MTSVGSDLSSAAAPAIFNLNDDLLLHIFHLNTYTPETEYSIHSTYTRSDLSRPLTVAHHTSQVCHVWRQTLLGSPTIWGSLIDMTILETRSELWTQEVLKRTGESDLEIYGRVGKGLRSLFNSVLDLNTWHRVRRVDICLDKLTPAWYSSFAFWRVLSGRLAPRLEKLLFTVAGDYACSAPQGRIDGGLGRILAPSLCRYHCPIFVLDHRETWLPQLSSLTLSHLSSTADVLGVLETAVHLESLIIIITVDSQQVSTPRLLLERGKLYLPKLVCLDISGTVSQSLLFLQKVVTHPDCTLILRVKDLGEEFSEERNDLLFDVIAPYTARYFGIRRPPRLMIDVGTAEHRFQAIQSTDMMYFQHPETSVFYRPFGDRSFNKVALFRERIVDSLSTTPLGSVVELEITSDRFRSVSMIPTPGLVGLMESLSATVKTLIVSPNSFQHLNDMNFVNPDPTSSHTVLLVPVPVLPFLKVIRLKAKEAMSMSLPYFEMFQRDVLLFFSQRKVAGVPLVPKLEIADIVMPYFEHDWSFLDAIQGLKVVWKTDSEVFEYICGSGDKEQLNWRRNRGGRTLH